MLKKRICKYCGKEFETEYCNKYCCHECLILATKKNLGIKNYTKTLLKKVCKWCGKEFETVNTKKVYCSSHCNCAANKYNHLPESGWRICEYCGKKYYYTKGQSNWKKDDTLSVKGITAYRFCSYECGIKSKQNNFEKTSVQKYGVKNAGGSQAATLKGKLTKLTNKNLNPNYQNEINKKRQTTFLSKYGVDHPSKSTAIKNKIRSTCLQKYDVDWPSKVKEVKQKVKSTISHKKAIDSNYQKNIIDKIQATTKERYGVLHYAETQEAKQKIKEKWKNKSKEEIASIQAKIKNTCKLRYGDENYKGREKLNWKEVIEKGFETKKKNGTLNISTGEKQIYDFIKTLGFKPTKYIIGNNHESKRFEIDIYIPELNIGIEYNGTYYHSSEGPNGKNISTYHYNKSKYASELGIQLIHIWEDQWKNNQDIIKSILKARLNKLENNTIYARSCEIKEISGKQYKEFCINNHIQGYRQAKVKLGLFYNNKLVQIASFNKVKNLGKQNRKEEWEWIRGCPASNNLIIGGVSKLFKYFIKKYTPKSILCYADWNLFNGKGYEKIGFKFDGYTGPNKFYVTNTTVPLRINRNPYKYKEFKKLIAKNKLYTCYGAGSLRFIWKA